MATKEDAAYQEWLRETEGKLPDEVKDAFKTLTSTDAGKEVFRGSLRRSDYDRRVGEITARRQELEKWYEDEAPKNTKLVNQLGDYQQKLQAYETTLRELGLEEADIVATRRSPGAPPPSVIKRDDIEALRKELKEQVDGRVNVIDNALPAILGDLATIVQKSVKEGYNIDPRDVLSYAAENRLSPLAAFESLTSVERSKRAEAAAKAEQEKWKEEGRREALSKMPSPTYIRPNGPTVVENLSRTDFASDPRSRVAESVKDFLEGDFKGAGNGLF